MNREGVNSEEVNSEEVNSGGVNSGEVNSEGVNSGGAGCGGILTVFAGIGNGTKEKEVSLKKLDERRVSDVLLCNRTRWKIHVLSN